MYSLAPRCARRASIVSAVLPEAEIPTASVSREGSVGLPVDASSATASIPRERRSAAAATAAKRELPIPMKTTRREREARSVNVESGELDPS
jgi:hypothetical protein